MPGDPVVLVNGTNDGDANSGPPPGGENETNAINDEGQKYLNFLDFDSGFIVTPAFGSSVVTGLRLYTANDAEERDPASYRLEGSNVGSAGPFTLISQGALSLPSGRNAGGATPPVANEEVNFANTVAYTSYRLTFPTLKDAAAANSMQIGEVEFLGLAPPPAPPADPTAVPVMSGIASIFLTLMLTGIAMVNRRLLKGG